MNNWKNNLGTTGEAPAASFLANPFNWRIHTATQQDVVGGLLDELGWIDRVTVSRRTGLVLNGHLRIKLALRRGDDTPVPFEEVDLTPEQEALALATLDSSTALAGTDGEALAALVAQAQEAAPQSDAVLAFLDDLSTEALQAAAVATGGASGGGRQIGKGGETTITAVLAMPELRAFEEAILATGERNRAAALLRICAHYLRTGDAERQYDPEPGDGAAPGAA